ncbi:hypothetical protein Tco_0610333 [Tanacetum coccineum]
MLILDKEKFNGSNFLDWYRNLRIVLRNEKKVAEQQGVACLMLAEQELFETVKAFHAYKQEEGQSVSTYMLKMKAYLDQMERLGYPIPLVLGTGHWKRNCPLYLAQLKKNKASMSGTSGIFTIELFSFPKSNSWIYDIGCGTNICNTIQGLRGYQKLNKGDLDLYVSNGNSAVVEAIGSFDLILLSEIILVLDNYPKEIMDYFYYPLENKILVARYAEFFKSSLISQEASGSTTDFDEIQRQDAQPSKTTIQHQPVIEQDDVDPQTDVIPVRRSARIPQAPE